MAGQNLGQRRVINPILSNLAQKYENAEMVGNALFPRVPVSVSGGQIIEFGKEAFRLYNARRAPGANTQRIDFGYLGKPFALVQDALEAKVPIEHMRDAKQVPNVDLAQSATTIALDALLLGLEYEQAQVALAGANYDSNHKIALSGESKWSSSTSKPLAEIDNYKEAVRASTGRDPNILLLSALAFKALKNHEDVIERFKYTGRDSITTAMIASLLDIEKVVVGRAVYANQAGEFSDVWGNNAVLAYVPTSTAGIQQPSYGYTYTMNGNPFVKEPYYDPNAESWIYGVHFERAAVLAGMNAGFLIQNTA